MNTKLIQLISKFSIILLVSLIEPVLASPEPGEPDPNEPGQAKAPAVESVNQAQIKVSINGIDGDLLTNVRAMLSLHKSRTRSLSADAIAALHALSEAEIKRALQPFGYYRPDVKTLLQPADSNRSSWQATYTIDAGPVLPIRAVEIAIEGAGESDPELARLVAELPLQSNQTLNHSRYEAAKTALLQQIKAQGYLDAILTMHRIEVDLNAYSAFIQLHINSGAPYVFGPIEFEQKRFSAQYLQRFLILADGDRWSNTAIAEQRRILSRSGHFQEVEIRAQAAIAGAEPAIPLIIHLQPFLANRYRGHLGWGTDTGYGIQLDWTRRHLGKRGQRFSMGGTLVEERNRLASDLSYLIPLDPLSGNEIALSVRHESKDLTFEDVDLDEGSETRIATNLISAMWHLPKRNWGSFELDAAAGFSLVTETYDIFEVLFGNLPREIQEIIIDNIGIEAHETLAPEFEVIAPSLKLSLRRSDDPLYILDGDFFQLEIFGASDQAGSNINFWQARLSAWSIRQVFEKGRILLRTAIGYSDAESRNVLGVNFNQIPEYYEFRAGGAHSVRGYGFETLFPGDALTGGKHQLSTSIEYEHEIIPDWSAAIFVDAGNAFNSFDDIDPKLGAGIGFRWRSPVGLARLDLGFPLDDAEDSFQIYITVGPEF